MFTHAYITRRSLLKNAAGVGLAFSGSFASPPLFTGLFAAETKKPLEVDLSIPSDVTDAEMQRVYEEIRTPFKYGVVLPQEDGDPVDSPNVFRYGDAWYMLYLRFLNKTGYVAKLAKSYDLLHWESSGTVAPFREIGWDAWQCSPSAALVDYVWGGSCAIQPYDGKYWFTYLGGAGKGYEPDPLKIGFGATDDPSNPAA